MLVFMLCIRSGPQVHISDKLGLYVLFCWQKVKEPDFAVGDGFTLPKLPG